MTDNPIIDDSVEVALAESVREVMEKMFFVDIVDSPRAGPEPEGIAAELCFDGDPPGSFRLVLDRRAARSVAADFLGSDPEALTLEQLDGVVCELANMVCGSVLSRIESTAAFRLSTPTLAPDADRLRTPLGTRFQASLNDGMLHAEIHMERPVCPGIEASGS